MFNKACQNGTELFGFTFEKDPDWVPSRAVRAADVETGESFEKPSVGEMSNVVYGPDYHNGTARICEMCKNGKTYRGLGFGYVNDDDGYITGYGSGTDIRDKPVQQLHKNTDVVINEFSTITHAAHYIWSTKQSRAMGVGNIKKLISQCVNGSRDYNGTYLGYKWRFTP